MFPHWYLSLTFVKLRKWDQLDIFTAAHRKADGN